MPRTRHVAAVTPNPPRWPSLASIRGLQELASGVVPLAVRDALDGHGERVTAGIPAAGDSRVDVAAERGQAVNALLRTGDLVAQCIPVAVVGALGALQPGQLSVRFGFVISSGLPVARALTSL